MNLDDVFPAHGGVANPAAGIFVGGRPLPDVLAAMMALIRQQQTTIGQLQIAVQQQLDSHHQRLDRLEHYAAAFMRDLKLESRPLSFYGQPAAPTIADAVTTVEYRLTQLELRRKHGVARELGLVTSKRFAGQFFERWVRFQRFRAMLRLIRGDARAGSMRQYFRRWTGLLALRREQRAHSRKLRALQFTAAKVLVRRYLGRWSGFVQLCRAKHAERRAASIECAQAMATVTMRGLARRYFLRWFARHQLIQRFAGLSRQAGVLEQVTARRLAGRALRRWVQFAELIAVGKMRRRVVSLHATKAFHGLARRYLGGWIAHTQRRLRRRQAAVLIPRLHHAQLVALARRYFIKLGLFGKWQQEKRQREELDALLQHLVRRCDALSAQLDVGMHTLSHTNSVLARVVDAILVDDNEAARLLRSNAGDALGGGSAVNVSGSSAAAGAAGDVSGISAAGGRGGAATTATGAAGGFAFGSSSLRNSAEAAAAAPPAPASFEPRRFLAPPDDQLAASSMPAGSRTQRMTADQLLQQLRERLTAVYATGE